MEFIGRVIQHLPAKNFRMVRYYGIYARTVRNKVHALVADVRRRLQQGLDRVRELFRPVRAQTGGGQAVSGVSREGLPAPPEPSVGRVPRCARCGRAMLLVRIWDQRRGMIYDLFAVSADRPGESGSGVAVLPTLDSVPSGVPGAAAGAACLCSGRQAQLLFAFIGNLAVKERYC